MWYKYAQEVAELDPRIDWSKWNSEHSNDPGNTKAYFLGMLSDSMSRTQDPARSVKGMIDYMKSHSFDIRERDETLYKSIIEEFAQNYGIDPEPFLKLTEESSFSSGGGMEYNGQQLTNGEIPEELLADIGGGKKLLTEAARAWFNMKEAAQINGVVLEAVSAYRDIPDQIRVKEERGHFAAEVGKSPHGFGIALDISVKDRPDVWRWLNENAAKYGWEQPDWAKPGGRLEEPWHWEFTGISLR